MASKQDPVVTEIKDLTKPGRDAHDNRRRRFDKAYNVYRAKIPRSPTTASWQSSISVPFAMQSVDTALVNIIGGPPRIKVKPRLPGQEESAKKMQVLLDYYVYADSLAAKQHQFVQQGLIYGVTAAKVHWLYREADKMSNEFFDHPTEPDQQIRLPASKTVVLKDGPTFEPWNIYDIWWDPNGRNVEDCEYVVLRSWLSKDQLLAKQFDPETGRGYQNLDELFKLGKRKGDASAQEQYLGTSDSVRKNKFELWEVWRDSPPGGSYCVIGNQEVLLIPPSKNPYWHGRKPVVVSQCRPDGFQMAGISLAEMLDDLQQTAITLQRARLDALNLTVKRGITYREGGVTDPNALEMKPGFKWPVTDHDDIRPFEFPPLTSDVYHEDERVLALMQLISGINPYVSGADTAGVDQNTATGITALQEVASRLLRFMARMVTYQGYLPAFVMWGEMIQQLLDKPQWVRIQGPGSEEKLEQVTPQEVVGDFDFFLEGTEESLSRQQERGEAVALLNAFAPFVQLGVVDIRPVLEKVALAYDFPNPEALIPKQQPAPQAYPQGQQNGGGQPQAQELLGGQQMPPQVQNAVTSGQ